VADQQSAQIAKRFLGPLFVFGSPVWVNSTYADNIKNQLGVESFRAWIRPFSAHNQKVGYNSDMLLKRFKAIDPYRVKLPSPQLTESWLSLEVS